MKVLRSVLVSYTPFIVLLPFSVTISLYTFYNYYQLLEKAGTVLYMYAGLILAPVVFLFLKPSNLSAEILEVLEKCIRRLNVFRGAFIFLFGAYATIYLWSASKHIATYVERDRWILDGLPLIPFDPPLLPRMAVIISWFTKPDMAMPLLGLLFVLIWFSFLLYAVQVESNSFLFLTALFSVVYLNGTFFDSMYANMELPAAIIAYTGLYGIWRGKYNAGLFLLIIGGVFKNTGLFFLITGAFIFAYMCLKERSVWKIISKLDISVLIFSFVYPILNHWGSFYYVQTVRGGSDYLVTPQTINLFWVSSFLDLVFALFSVSAPLVVLGLIGVFINKDNKLFALFALGVLISLRSLQGWMGGLGSAIPYSMMFIPAFSFFAMRGLKFLMDKINIMWIRNSIPVFLILFGVGSLTQMLSSFPGGMSRINSNFDEYIRKLAARFPDDGTIYQNDISIAPYLIQRRGGDLDAIIFRTYPNNREDFISELTRSGCKLIIAEKKDLPRSGISEDDMSLLGYSQEPYLLNDSSGTWVSYSKECNAWEYD